MSAMTIVMTLLFAISSGLLLSVVLETRHLRRGFEASRMMYRQADALVHRLASRLEHAEAYGAQQHEHMFAEKERLEIARLRIVVLTKERDEARAELAKWRPGRLPDGRFVKVMEAVR